jgi:hypothetical protein
VLGVAAVAVVAVVASYEHAYHLVRAHGESGWTARLVIEGEDHLVQHGLQGRRIPGG